MDIKCNAPLNLPAVKLITNSNRVCMVTAYWDGDVEYFSLWYYHGCLKYWLRVLKPIEVIGMHVRTRRLSTSLIYRSFWCNSMGEKVNKTWLKDKFPFTTIIWHKAQIIESKILLSSETHSFLSYSPTQEEKGWEETRGTQELLILLNFPKQLVTIKIHVATEKNQDV